ncbi:hypothetical protein Avbf_15594 [Armadillidium vulgare]|nr:hypothetical protein Avbf_15594 [Armadillidium vulgare]
MSGISFNIVIDLKEWTSDKYGKCYTFNSFFGDAEIKGKTKRNVKKARTAGPKSGLKLTLNVKTAICLVFIFC